VTAVWLEVPLGKCCEVLPGFAFDSAQFTDGDGMPLVRIRDVVRGRTDTYFNGSFDKKFLIADRDLLIGMDGQFNRATWQGGPALLNQRVCKVAGISDLIDDRYLFHFLPQALKGIEDETPFVTVKHLSTPRLKAVPIPLPPISEQRRIAAILDTADEVRAKHRAALETLQSLGQAVYREKFGDPLSGDCLYPTTTLAQAVDFVGGGTPSRAIPAYYNGDICWATSKDMKRPFLDGTQEHITNDAIARSATKLVPEGTVLVVVKSKVLAHSLPVALARVPTCFGQDLKGLKPKQGWDSAFVAMSIRIVERWLLKQARGVNTEGLTLEHLRSVPIIEAPPSEQAAFGRVAETLERMATTADGANLALDALYASLQQRAFQGAL
jgi:type I restriction enzyme S subunit